MVIMVCSRPCCCCAPQCAVTRIPLRSFQMEGDQFELVAKQGTEGLEGHAHACSCGL